MVYGQSSGERGRCRRTLRQRSNTCVIISPKKHLSRPLNLCSPRKHRPAQYLKALLVAHTRKAHRGREDEGGCSVSRLRVAGSHQGAQFEGLTSTCVRSSYQFGQRPQSSTQTQTQRHRQTFQHTLKHTIKHTFKHTPPHTGMRAQKHIRRPRSLTNFRMQRVIER